MINKTFSSISIQRYQEDTGIFPTENFQISYKPVGIPSTFEPRPNPFITGPPMHQGFIGKVPSTPATITNQNTSSNDNDITKKTSIHTHNTHEKAILRSWVLQSSNGGRPHFSSRRSSKELITSSAAV